jgi:hypothetical protein
MGYLKRPPLHNNKSNINVDEGWSLLISHEKYIKDGKVLAHLGCQSKVFPGLLTD